MDLLNCTVMRYAWGSRTAIASLVGRPSPSDTPEAELWMGAHPLAPSTVNRDGAMVALDALIRAHPQKELGEATIRELGARLPFLLKILAAAEPLSLQAHPNAVQARAGFEDEERREVPLDAPTRSYKDDSHKPELLCALSPFVALSGFRDATQTLALFDDLGVEELETTLAPLRREPGPRGLESVFRALMTTPPATKTRLVTATVNACAKKVDSSRFGRERALVAKLHALYPDDIGVVVALLLELVRLEPGQAIFLAAGNLHAYLEGTGVEIMASSDNVLRGGLTTKHVDTEELLKVLDFSAGPARVITPRRIDAHESVYDTPAREFRLSRIALDGDSVVREVHGPEILLLIEGEVRATGTTRRRDTSLIQGQSLFVPASTRQYTLEGEGVIFRATTNL